VCFRQIHTTGPAHIEYYFRNTGDRLVAGDWGTTDGVDTVAVYRPPQTTFHFRHSNTHGVADAQLTWGSHWIPIAADFGSASLMLESVDRP
jgi:hypothetical protein